MAASCVVYSRVLSVPPMMCARVSATVTTSDRTPGGTSGADGLHIYISLPAGTPYEAGLLYCQIIATVVEQKHPRQATTERSVRARGKRVYVDCFQNILGKTLASAYSARASDYAGVSTPLTWKEVEAGVDRRDFTITSVPARVDEVGDLWAALRKGKPVNLERVTKIG